MNKNREALHGFVWSVEWNKMWVKVEMEGRRMKEMIYKEQGYEILDQGEYKGRKYFIISYGAYPCAYVENKENYDYDDLENLNVHGGVTFNGTKENTRVIGWDYAHCCDYFGYLPNLGGKKWTTSEIKEEVFAVIDQLENMKCAKKDNG